MKTVKLIFPHQLFQFNPIFSEEGCVYLIEESLFFNQFKFHKQKIAFHRASMKFYESFLLEKGVSVKYVQAHEPEADIRLLIAQLYGSGIESLAIIDPVDNWLLSRIKISCQKLKMDLRILDSPMFLNNNQDLEHFFKLSKKRFFQTEFYKQERIKRKILIDEAGAPLGGQWTFDEENRKKYPKAKPVVKVEFPKSDPYVLEARAYTNQYFPDNIGELSDDICYPIGFSASEKWLDEFLENRMKEFGDYEDAIVHKEHLLNHSLLTPMLNIGMLTPHQIIQKTLNNYQENGFPINSLEGFIRQIIGWREFIGESTSLKEAKNGSGIIGASREKFQRVFMMVAQEFFL